MPRYSNKKSGVVRFPADKWFSLCVRHRANYQCESCGGEASDCCHLFGRRKYATRWHPLNAIALCRTCHNNFGNEPLLWVDFIDQRWPGRRDELLRILRTRGRNTPEIRKAVAKHYNAELRRMESDGSREFSNWEQA